MISQFMFAFKLNTILFLRNKGVFFSVFLFGVCVLILFPFCLGTEIIRQNPVRLGCYWIVQEFVAVMIVMRLFTHEENDNIFNVYKTSRISKITVLCAKILFTWLQLCFMQILIFIMWFLFFNMDFKTISDIYLNLTATTFLFALSSSALGVMIFCTTSKTSGRDLLQPILFFPLQSSTLLACVSLCLESVQALSVGVFSSTVWWCILVGAPMMWLGAILIFHDLLLD